MVIQGYGELGKMPLGKAGVQPNITKPPFRFSKTWQLRLGVFSRSATEEKGESFQ